jgi:putative NADH-flavin reductase
MKVVIFGSTGGTGLEAVAAFVAAGHQVTAFARDPAKIPSDPAVTVVRGDVMDAADVSGAVTGHDAVIVSLGNSQNPVALMVPGARRTTAADVCEVGTRHIIAAMQASGMARLVVVTAFGVGDTRDKMPFAFKVFYWAVLREQMADKERQEAAVKASGLDWTLVQPVGLTDGKATGRWLADAGGVIRRQQISRGDMAAFLVLAVGEERYFGATISLSG